MTKGSLLGIGIILQLSCFLSCSYALPNRLYRKATPISSLSNIASSYDYVIVGGGAAGLTVGDRLTEDSSKTVLVIEFGQIVDNDTTLIMPSKGNPFPTQYMYNITSVPQTNLNNRTSSVPISSILGGGSAINAMFFDRGAKEDYDAWEELGNEGWGWEGLLPYFKKAVNFTPPSAEMQKGFNVTYDLSAYGGNGPIQLSYPPFQWPGVKIEWDAFDDLKLKAQKEGANGNAVGRFWVPSSQFPTNQTRSDARIGHYERVESRPNYHLLILHKAIKINFNNLTAIGVVIQSRDDPSSKRTVSAVKEVVLAAGAVHTPQLLQLSGVGPKRVLESAGVTTLVDLGGVGQNFQDHPFFFMQYNFTTDVWPNPETLTDNATFAAEAYDEYWANRTGPYSVGIGNTGAFVPLQNLTSDYQKLASSLSAQNMSAYADATAEKSVIQGFEAQKAILVNRFRSTSSAVMEFPFSASVGPVFALLKPTSRGTITLNTSFPSSEPIVDFRTFSNPIDVDVTIRLLRYARTYFSTPTMAQLGPVEIVPGSAVSTDAEINASLRSVLVQPSFFHPCCTAALGPRDQGGVVSADLLVYGASKLSIVDASVMPMLPGTHLCQTVYAIAEKAADIIKARA